jgi:hypothetical protein
VRALSLALYIATSGNGFHARRPILSSPCTRHLKFGRLFGIRTVHIGFANPVFCYAVFFGMIFLIK